MKKFSCHEKLFLTLYSIFYIIYLFVRAIKRVCLPNIILNEDVIQELIQHKSKPNLIAKEIIKIITNDNYQKSMIAKLQEVCDTFSDKNAPLIVAQKIAEELS